MRLSGAGQVRGEGPLRVGDLDLRLSGAGHLKLELQAKRVEVRLSGAGAVELSGTAAELEIRLSGAGVVRADRPGGQKGAHPRKRRRGMPGARRRDPGGGGERRGQRPLQGQAPASKAASPAWAGLPRSTDLPLLRPPAR